MLTELNRYTWEEIRAMDLADAWYVMPIAATEQHGPHLPLGTDDLILHDVLRRVVGDERIEANMLLLPAVPFGNSHEHLTFPGTVSLSCATIVAIVRDVLRSMQCTGVNKLVFVNGHGGNTPLLDAYAQEWAQEFGFRIFHVSLWGSPFYGGAAQLVQTPLAQEIHGGEMETSMLLYALPEAVKREKISPAIDCPGSLTHLYQGWCCQELSPNNGAVGVPSRASAKTGEKLMGYTVDRLVHDLIEITRLPW